MIFVTTHAYALGYRLGIERAAAEFQRQCQAPDNDSLPVVRTITRLRKIDQVWLWLDTGATRLAESRSRAFHAALESHADVWFACDDDCEATFETVNWMVDAVRDEAVVCLAPYWARLSQIQDERINLQIPEVPEGQARHIRYLKGNGKTIEAKHGGMGLVATSRQAMERIAQANSDQELKYTDTEGVTRIAIFLEYIKEGFWMGEDLAFFSRIPPDVRIEALVTGMTMHHGKQLDLELLVLGAVKLGEADATAHSITQCN